MAISSFIEMSLKHSKVSLMTLTQFIPDCSMGALNYSTPHGSSGDCFKDTQFPSYNLYRAPATNMQIISSLIGWNLNQAIYRLYAINYTLPNWHYQSDNHCRFILSRMKFTLKPKLELCWLFTIQIFNLQINLSILEFLYQIKMETSPVDSSVNEDKYIGAMFQHKTPINC